MRSKFFSHILTASALTLVMGGTAYAAGAGDYQSQQPGQTGAMQQDQMQQQAGQVDFSNVYKSSSLKDLDVQDPQGESIGKIDDVLIDSNGQASHVVVAEEGGMLGGAGQSYVIPWDQLQIDAQQQTASVNVPKDQLSTEFSAFEELPPTKLDQQQQQQQPQQQPQPQDGMGGSPDSQMQ